MERKRRVRSQLSTPSYGRKRSLATTAMHCKLAFAFTLSLMLPSFCAGEIPKYLQPISLEEVPALRAPEKEEEKQAVKNPSANPDRTKTKQARPKNPSAATSVPSPSNPNQPLASMDFGAAFKPGFSPNRKPSLQTRMRPLRDPHMGAPIGLTKYWVADNLAHRRLYFEDLPLERHGQMAPRLQPLISMAKFYGDVIAASFRALHCNTNDCFYVQCEGRPGSPICR